MQSSRVWALLVAAAASTVAVSAISITQVENTDYVVEVLAVVDKPAIEKWINASGAASREDVREEVKSLFFEVNAIYQSLRAYNLNIEVRLKDVLFPDESVVPLDRVEGTNKVQPTFAGVAMTMWLTQHGYKPGTDYDHAMYLTSYNLPGVRGTAERNAVCSKKGRSRVRITRKYDTVMTAAHELAHSLGSGHDTEDPCKGGYVMTPRHSPSSRKRWLFSPCTARMIKNSFSKRTANNCLTKTTSAPIVSPRMGELLDVYETCNRVSGSKPLKTSGDEVCNTVTCIDGRIRAKATTPEGMPCGDNKRCFQGFCVEA